MSRYILLAVSIILLSINTKAQDCNVLMPQGVDQIIEMTDYSPKDKVTGKTISTVLEKSETDQGELAKMKIESYDAKGKEQMKGEYELECKDGILYMDMSSLLPENTKNSFQGGEFELEGDFVEFPSELKAGDELKDASMTFNMSSAGVSGVSFKVLMQNRKVEGIETLETPAGSFECYKISQEIVSDLGVMKLTTKSIQWFAKNLGVVKTEHYSNNGKMSGYSLITRLEK